MTSEPEKDLEVLIEAEEAEKVKCRLSSLWLGHKEFLDEKNKYCQRTGRYMYAFLTRGINELPQFGYGFVGSVEDIKKLPLSDFFFPDAPFIVVLETKTGDYFTLPLEDGKLKLCRRDPNEELFSKADTVVLHAVAG